MTFSQSFVQYLMQLLCDSIWTVYKCISQVKKKLKPDPNYPHCSAVEQIQLKLHSQYLYSIETNARIGLGIFQHMLFAFVRTHFLCRFSGYQKESSFLCYFYQLNMMLYTLVDGATWCLIYTQDNKFFFPFSFFLGCFSFV